jgi:hypothetical protein
MAMTIGLMAQFHLPGSSSGSGAKSPPAPPPEKPAVQAPGPVQPTVALPAIPAKVDHFILSLSVRPGRILVDGFRAQAKEGADLESCETVKPAPRGALRIAETLMANQAAMQQEWKRHGSCSGYGAAEYFNALRFARSLVQIPVQLTSPEEDAPQETLRLIESQYASANTGFPAGAFRARASAVEVCFDLQLKPQSCSPTDSK